MHWTFKEPWNFLLFEKNGGMPSPFVHCSPILWKRFGFAEVPRKAAPRKGQNEAGCLLVGTNPAPGPIPYCMQYDSQNVRYPNHYTQRVGILIVKPRKKWKRSSLLLASKVILQAFQSNHSRSCQMLSAKGNHIGISWFHPPNASTVIESFPPFHGFVQPASLK